MKKAFCLLGILLLFQITVPAFADNAQPEIKASAAILMDRASGRTLYEKNADEKRYPASTTKIMTALLAIENLNISDSVTASAAAVDIDRDGSNMGILTGEELTVEQLLYGLLVHSANDAANVLAEAVSGSIGAFVEKMNARASELGMNGTQFINPHGYHDDNHYTTARDLSLLASAAMQSELFAAIVATPSYEIPPTNKYTQERRLSNNNALINPMRGRKYLYSAATGIKTGHTSKAGNCLVSSAEKDNTSLICVVLDAPDTDGTNYSFADTITLFQYGFEHYRMRTVSDTSEILVTKEVQWAAGNAQAVLSVKEPFSALLPTDFNSEKLKKTLSVPDKLKAPLRAGETVGSVSYYYDDVLLGEAELVSQKTVKRSNIRMIFGTLLHWFLSVWVMVPLGILVAILLILRWLEIKRQQKRRRQRKFASRRGFYK